MNRLNLPAEEVERIQEKELLQELFKEILGERMGGDVYSTKYGIIRSLAVLRKQKNEN